uniref:Lysyl oxidase homolog n=1 Tax=Mola mola TaxID=94237 RepID=A0A3Q3X8G7_MOLML
MVRFTRGICFFSSYFTMMAKWSLLCLYCFQGLLPFVFGQQRTSGPWRHRIQWENNGQLYSLMSSGSEYQAPGWSRSQSRVYVTGGDPAARSFNFENAINASAPAGLTGSPGRRGALSVDVTSPYTRGEGPGPRAQYQELGAAPESMSVSTQPAQSHNSITGTLERESAQSQAASEDGEAMVNDDPRNPFKNQRNSVFYNMYQTSGRSMDRPHRPPGTGHGTRYFQNGLPDLVPDPYSIQAGAYIQRMQMFALRCAAEENCLSRSAYGPAVRDVDFRVLLRFPQKVKNQGTRDFLPVKPRYQWDWHSCHQHYHSMDAFSNYDLLDVVTGRKVAEGHKASFCLEDTGCDSGFRRRYACTSHTQGLSPGCHDIYAANIDCQWIDITDVPPGNYILKVTVNPNFHVLESDFTNNIVTCDITYTGIYVQTHHCRVTR